MILGLKLFTLLILSAARVRAGEDGDGFGDQDFPEPSTVPLTAKKHGRFCVPYYQCRDGNIITDGSGLLDPRKTTLADIPLNGKVTPSSCHPPYVLCNVSDGSLEEQPYRHQCGLRRPNGIDARILSSKQNGETEFGEFPWQGAILQEVSGQKIFKCACVLINRKWALTVAHCLKPLRNSQHGVYALFGVRDTKSKEEALASQTLQIANYTLHRDYDENTLRYDVALVRFRESVNYNPSVESICLPYQNEDHTGQNCIVTGWGKNAWDGGNYSPVLRKVTVPIISHFQCQELLRKTRLGQFYNLHKGSICAGGTKGQDSCKGDGGGPLACYRSDGTYSLMGLVSWGIDCGQPNVPGVYTSVLPLLRWISQTTGLETSDFWPPTRGL